jgi:geranylgeranyl pyrophosphate synthase
MIAMEDESAARKLRPLLQDGRKLSAADASKVVDIVRAVRAPQHALERAQHFASSAGKQLDVLDGWESRAALMALTDYVVSRKL